MIINATSDAANLCVKDDADDLHSGVEIASALALVPWNSWEAVHNYWYNVRHATAGLTPCSTH